MLSRKVIWYDFDNFRLEVESQRLLKNGVPLILTPKTFQTLLILVEHAGETVEKDEIYNHLWTDSFVEEGNLTQYIYVLRKHLGQNSSGQSYIETVARQGYRFVSEVKTTHAEILVETPDDKAKKIGRFEDNSDLSIDESTDREQNESHDSSSNFNVLSDSEKPARTDNSLSGTDYALQTEKSKFRSRKWRLTALLLVVVAGIGLSIYFVIFLTIRRNSNIGGERKIKSIAILPFKAIGEESANEHLGLGMTDAIITRLSQLKQIPVRPTSAVYRFVETETLPEKVGRDLQVDAILEGTVQRGGNWVRVSVRLIKVETGETIWAEKFDGEYTHIFKVQDIISAKVVDSLALSLSPNQEQPIKKRATENIEAYQAYTLGAYFWNKRTAEDLEKAERHFLRAIELDPQYAQAYAGLADTYNMLVFIRARSLAEVGEKAKNAALKAVELDETVAEGHMALAQVQFTYARNAEAGDKSLQRAIELAPYNATAHLRYGWRMAAARRLDAAEQEMRLAQEYDPLSPTNNVALCNVLMLARKYEEAKKFCERALEIDRRVPSGRVNLAEVFLLLGKDVEAVSMAEEEVRENPNDLYSQGNLAYVYARAGKIKKADSLAEKLSAEAEKNPFLYTDLALVNYIAGRHDKSLENFDKALEKRGVHRVNLIYDPKFDEIKKEPRFSDLLKQHGLSLN